MVGVRPPARAVLEVNYGFLFLANGRPMGYGGFTPLFRQANTGINIFPDFRGAEAAFVFQQYLRMIHTIAGCTRFIINPYQLGDGNDEALASGAYWFYYRLGFRSAGAAERRLADREFARLSADRRYRVPIAVLRRLGAVDVHLELPGEPADALFEERWLDDLAAGATALIAREGVAERQSALARIARRVAATLGVAGDRWSASEQRSLAGFAPIVGQIEGLQQWAATDKRALVELIRLRAAPLEREFALRARTHDRLRMALTDRSEGSTGGNAMIERHMVPGQAPPYSHYCHVVRADRHVWVSGAVGVGADGAIPDGTVDAVPPRARRRRRVPAPRGRGTAARRQGHDLHDRHFGARRDQPAPHRVLRSTPAGIDAGRGERAGRPPPHGGDRGGGVRGRLSRRRCGATTSRRCG